MRPYLVVLSMWFLSGCGGGVTSLPDVANTADLSASKQAILICKVGMTGSYCQSSSLVLGQQVGTTFKEVRTIKAGRTRRGEHNITSLKLPAGTYHVVSYVCTHQSGNRVYTNTIGKREGGWGTGTYKNSFASFSAAKGEVVNLGYLKFVKIGGILSSLYEPRAVPIPEAQLALYRKEKPNLTSQMIDRPFVVKSNAERRKKLCDILKKIQKPGAKPLRGMDFCATESGPN